METTSEKKERKPSYSKFCDDWLKRKEYQGWLQKTSKKRGNYELALCKICDTTLIAHNSDLIKHMKSNKHQRNVANMLAEGLSLESSMEVENQNEIAGYATNEVANQIGITEYVTKAENNLNAFAEEHNLSTQATECLVPLCRDIFPDSHIATKIAIISKKTKTAQIIKKSVGNNLGMLYMKLKVPGMFFSIYMDETTDQSANKQYTLTVAFMDKEKGVRYSFFDSFSVTGLFNVTDLDLYSSLKDSILSKGIPLENLVGFSSNATDVNSVFSPLQIDCPDIAYIKWSCHTISLAASEACSKLPTHVEDLLRSLGSHFSSRYGTLQKLVQFQEFFHVDIHKFLSSATTSWLSVKECVDRVLEQYVPLLAYFKENLTDDPFDTMQTILDTMNDPFTKAYLKFMSYILGILYEFNKIFQAEKPLLHKMKTEVEILLQEIYLNFLCTDYVRKTPAFEIDYTDSSYYLPNNEIYLGISASETIKNLKQKPDILEKDVASYFENILNFYVELVRVVRREFDFHDEFYNIVSTVVDPQAAQDFKVTSLVGVWKRFPSLKNFINIQALDNEWKKHSFLDHQLEGLDPEMLADDYWQKVSKLKNPFGGQAFPNLCVAMKLLLVLPFFPGQVLPIKEL